MTKDEYKAIREPLGTQQDVAERLGISRVTLARRETGALPVTREAELAMLSLKKRKVRV